MKRTIFLLLIAFLVSCSSQNSEKPTAASFLYKKLDEQARQMFGALPAVAENPNNPISDEKVMLGKVDHAC